MDKRLEGSFRKAIGFLEEEDYRYAVIGGIAVSQWGFPRATNDVDLKVLVPDTDYAGVRAALLRRFPERARINAPENPFYCWNSTASLTRSSSKIGLSNLPKHLKNRKS